MIWNTASTAAAADYFTFSVTHDATTDANTQRLLTLERKADGTGNQALEVLLFLNNLDDQEVTRGILIETVGNMTTAIDVRDPQIDTAINIGGNTILTTGSTITGS